MPPRSSRGLTILLDEGTLFDRAARASQSAQEQGALVTIPTHLEFVEDDGALFALRVLRDRPRKEQATLEARAQGHNPFLPYDERLFVAEVSDTHVCLLNKFNVVADHLIFVTRAYESQDLPLTIADLAALWTGLREIDGLGFYNGGTLAGASQPHRHLQLVPGPLGEPPARFPLEPLLRKSAPTAGRVARIPGFRFPHAAANVESLAASPIEEAAPALRALYVRLLLEMGRDPERPGAYNFLLTREVALLVPRARESWKGISINALGFAGSLFARTRADVDAITAAGPFEVLEAVASPR